LSDVFSAGGAHPTPALREEQGPNLLSHHQAIADRNLAARQLCLGFSNIEREQIGNPWFAGIRRKSSKSSDAKVSKLVSQIKAPSNVVSDTARRGLAAMLHSEDVFSRYQRRSV
jgi:hypothetical protein